VPKRTGTEDKSVPSKILAVLQLKNLKGILLQNAIKHFWGSSIWAVDKYT
jgi:hypothetical protein